MGEKLTFLKTFLQQPSNIGAIAPSSAGLVSMMIESFDWENVQSAIEYGPGTGVFTEGILKSMQEGTHFFAIEQSATMVEATPALSRGENLSRKCHQRARALLKRVNPERRRDHFRSSLGVFSR